MRLPTIAGLRAQRVDGPEPSSKPGAAIVGIANSIRCCRTSPDRRRLLPVGDSRNIATPHASRMSSHSGSRWLRQLGRNCRGLHERRGAYAPTAIDGGSLGWWSPGRTSAVSTRTSSPSTTTPQARNCSRRTASPCFATPACTAVVIQTTDGGARVHERGARQRDIRARKINADGSRRRRSPSVPLPATSLGRSSTTANGAIVAWTDRRAVVTTSTHSVYINCATQWTADGVAICTASGSWSSGHGHGPGGLRDSRVADDRNGRTTRTCTPARTTSASFSGRSTVWRCART